MIDVDRLTAKLSQLDHRLSRIRSHRVESPDALEGDEDSKDLLSFNLLVAVQSCLDIASHIIADEGWRPATKLAESFERLREHGVLTAETAAAMKASAGFRNVVAHAYEGLDSRSLYRASTQGIGDLETFAREIAGWMTSRPAGPPS